MTHPFQLVAKRPGVYVLPAYRYTPFWGIGLYPYASFQGLGVSRCRILYSVSFGTIPPDHPFLWPCGFRVRPPGLARMRPRVRLQALPVRIPTRGCNSAVRGKRPRTPYVPCSPWQWLCYRPGVPAVWSGGIASASMPHSPAAGFQRNPSIPG